MVSLVTAASYIRPRRVVYFNWPTMARDDESLSLSSGRESLLRLAKSQPFDSPRVFVLSSSSSLLLSTSARFLLRVRRVKGEVTQG